MTTREQVQDLINEAAADHQRLLLDVQESMEQDGAPRALSHEEVEHYRHDAKIGKLIAAVLLLADEVDRLKSGT
jgi:hypothetical protein